MCQYFVSRDVHACETGGYAVFLDVRKDRYTAVQPENVRYLRNAIHGWSQESKGDLEEYYGEGDSGILAVLLQEGLLTTSAERGKSATTVTIAEATQNFGMCPLWTSPSKASYVWNYVRAWAVATALIKTTSFGYVANRVLRRKEAARGCDVCSSDHMVHQMAMIHYLLQPVFYSVRNACLRSSLTLVEFFAEYNIYPTIAFGVKVRPFAAHAWVQMGSTVLNDSVEHVRCYTPIMAI
jgi:hypothetical protein